LPPSSRQRQISTNSSRNTLKSTRAIPHSIRLASLRVPINRAAPPSKDIVLATKPNANRPISPHLTIWKWGPHMLVSILHRLTGDGMATVGTVLFVWWLAALAGGPVSYEAFMAWFVDGSGVIKPLGYLFGIGLTLAFFQHMASGIRHFVLDTGAGYELKTNKLWAQSTMLVSIALTAAYWAILLKGH
jgi:succinate dehydrogenase / fumarate reductase cytochrome b subunit